MQAKATDLKEFYDSALGRMTQRILRQHISALWPDVKGLRVLGLGYATPYLSSFIGTSASVAALMPARQGAIYWPEGEKSLAVMCHESALPIETNSTDRILMIHAPEDAESLGFALKECWRVLTGQGQLILIVPNRTGIWARMDHTPFGRGTPWSLGQLRHVLKDNLFVPEKIDHALFAPPSHSRLILASAAAWENLGRKFFTAFGGVNVALAAKQLYAGLPAPTFSSSRKIAMQPITVTPPAPSRHGSASVCL